MDGNRKLARAKLLAQAEVRVLKDEVEQLKREKQDLRNALMAAKTDLEQGRGGSGGNETSSDRTFDQRVIASLAERCHFLKNQVAELQTEAELPEKRRKAAQIAKLVETLSEAKEHNAYLKGTSPAFKLDRINQLLSKLKGLKQTNTNIKAAAKQATISMLLGQAGALQRANNRLKGVLSPGDKAEQITALVERVKLLRQENVALKGPPPTTTESPRSRVAQALLQSLDISPASAISSLVQKLKELKCTNARLKGLPEPTAIQSQEAKLARIAVLVQQVKATKIANETLRGHSRSVVPDPTTKAAQIEELAKKLQTLQYTNSRLKGKIAPMAPALQTPREKTALIESLVLKLQALRAPRAHLDNAPCNKIATISELTDKLARLRQHNMALKKTTSTHA
jgi:hypothetical protein